MVLRNVLNKIRSRDGAEEASGEASNKSNSSMQRLQTESKKKLKERSSERLSAPKKENDQSLSKPMDQSPNYMKSTRSYDARKEKKQQQHGNVLTLNPSDSPPTTKIKIRDFNSVARAFAKSSSIKLLRASSKKKKQESTGKDLQTPDFNEELKKKLCPYTYCYMHGHHKHGAVPSLKRYLSGRGKSLKLRKSLKLKAYPSTKKKSDIEAELQDSLSVTNYEESGDKNGELSKEEIQVIHQFLKSIEKGCQENTLEDSEQLEEVESEEEDEEHKKNEDARVDEEDEGIRETGMNKFSGENDEEHKKNEVRDLPSSLTRIKVKYIKLRRASKHRESEPESESDLKLELIKLRNQAVGERKVAEEWMIDYNLRKALGRLGSARRKKVPMLVAAFENVMPKIC